MTSLHLVSTVMTCHQQFSKHRSLQRDFSSFLLLKAVIKLRVAKGCRKEMTSETSSSFGALRIEAAGG